MRILVVGAGAQGAPAVAVLSAQPWTERVGVVARTAAAAERVAARFGGGKAVAFAADAEDPAALAAQAAARLGGADVVLDLSPSFRSHAVMRAALALGAHYVNTAASPQHLAQCIARQPLELADAFATAGRTALLSCGASPGVLNVLCRRHCDELDTVERVEIRVGFHAPSQRAAVATWLPAWSPEQQYFDYCDPPCVFRDGQHAHVEPFHDPQEHDFGGRLGRVVLTHHAHDEQYTLPISIGKGMRHCSFRYPFEPAVATFVHTGFTPDRTVRVGGADVRAVDVLMQLLPRPGDMALLDAEAQRAIVPLLADTRAELRIEGTAQGRAHRIDVATAAFCDLAGEALQRFGVANVAVAYPAVVGMLQVLEGGAAAGIVWPEQLDPQRFLALAASLGLPLRADVRRTIASPIAI